MAPYWTTLLTWSATSAAALKANWDKPSSSQLWDKPSSSQLFPWKLPTYLDKDCSGNATCASLAREMSQSLSTAETRKLSAHEMDSLWNDGFVFLRGVLTNQKRLEKMAENLPASEDFVRRNCFWWTGDVSCAYTVMKKSMNTIPEIRALVNHTIVRSLFEQVAKKKFGSSPPITAPQVFLKTHGDHHELKDLHFGKAPPWSPDATCTVHQDEFPPDPTDTGKTPHELTLWIAMSHSTAPLALFRGSHSTWGSAFGKCANSTENGNHRWCWDLQCTKDNLGESTMWAANVEPGDMILMNKRTIHLGMEQETDRIALTMRYEID